MRQFAKKLVKFAKAEDGPTAVEYAVMLALIIVACIGTVTTLGGKSSGSFSSTSAVLPSGS
jgi:pilus assembly protein Flp/PilA